ncbi:MAG: DUF5615 family PIN-like protein [Candidatus Hydrogenedentes bacterium]|nr:DUF5615 family PIN-like protein [Candidatus Hydrogenedentota bacterium]
MRFLIDNAISPKVAGVLCARGFDCVHVRDVGMAEATDLEIFERAAIEQRVLVSADTDFGTLLATYQATEPSLILLRKVATHRPLVQAELILANLAALEESLERGCVVVIDEARIRIRTLPILES